MTADAIPTIDFAPFLNGSAADRLAVAREIGAAFESMGFMTLVGHGIPTGLVDRMRSLSEAFFNQDESRKAEVLSQPLAGQFCGFVPFAKDSAAVTYNQKEAPPDLRERYRAVCSTAEEVVTKVGPNQWPSEPADFESVWREYYRRMEQLSASVLRACALALGLPMEGLDPYFDRHFSVLVAAFSPLRREPPLPRQQRCGEHCDFGTLTLVHQDQAAGGLEIYSRGEWLEIPPRSQAFVVNIGDLMARWTNDRWVSTLHRVVRSPDRRAVPRLSLIYFNQPNLHAEIRCLESCRSPANPPKYEPITLQQHFTAQQAKLTAKQAGS